jgi:hypothetical protein
MAKRTKHICPPEAASLHDPATCPACERVANGEPALGPEASVEIEADDLEVIISVLSEAEYHGLVQMLRGGRVFVVRPEAIVRNPGAT